MEENNQGMGVFEGNTEPQKSAPPIQQIRTEDNLTSHISMNLTKNLSGWATFRAVIDIIVGGLSCLGGLLMLILSLIMFIYSAKHGDSSFYYSDLNETSAGVALGEGIAFLICGIIYPIIGILVILAGAKLIKTVDNLKMAVSVNDDAKILDFLNSLSKYFKFNGISTIIKISLMIAMIIFFIVLAVIFASDPNFHSGFGNFS